MVSAIREAFPATLNLGMGGTGPLFQLATLREYGPALRPATVVWFYFEGNDPRDLRRTSRSGLLLRYLEPGFDRGLIDLQAELDAAILAYLEEIEPDAGSGRRALLLRAHNVLSLRYVRTIVGVQVGGGFGESFPLFEQILRTATDQVTSWGGQMVFVYLPDWHRYFGQRSLGGADDEDRDRVLALMRALGDTLIDIHEVFTNTPDPRSLFPRPGDVHYNPLGHETVGRAVTEALLRLRQGTEAQDQP